MTLAVKYRDAKRPGWLRVVFAATTAEALKIKAELEKQGFIVENPVPVGPRTDPS